ncbi:MAG: glycogen/starch/alpha-glucan phosphorylase [Bacillota bacterium]|nr:glycogen/starch/alpha-glucan phosphorylase [Bacillota bacterium]
MSEAMTMTMTAKEISERIEGKLLRYFGAEPGQATVQQVYRAACMVVRDELALRWKAYHSNGNARNKKRVYYLSMEFLPGASLKNNLFNLGLTEPLRQALSSLGWSLEELCGLDPDAGLGNGGLGRLASCYLDAIASQGMSGHGMSICYEYGIFKQRILDGGQTEEPDDWLDLGEVWLREMEDEAEEVHFGGSLEEEWDDKGKMKLIHKDFTTVVAVPYDMLIPGYGGQVVNTLRLWKSTSPVGIDMKLFAQGKYLQAQKEKHMAEIISKILYPEDAHEEGKTLRIMQQYFFISASLQFLVRTHLKTFATLDNLHEAAAIHINDTHPAMAIPELLRILIDDHGMEWDPAWSIVKKTVSYTNHTILPEALEKWPEGLFSRLLPRLYSIVSEINRRQAVDLLKTFPDREALRREMAIIHNGELRMANLCVASAHRVNGVSALHSGLLRDKVFPGFYLMEPEKFTNVTNGIAYRRWLCQANPRLSGLIEELCGPGFKTDASQLKDFLKFKDDKGVQEELAAIKLSNKERLAEYIKEHNGVTADPRSIFDVQVKRLHEYKRQLLNLFHIMHLYQRLKEDPSLDVHPRTFLFGAKAAAGYYMAKEIISLAAALSRMIEKDPAVRERLRVVFLENYSVSLSELIMPAAEVSEQISLAGKEASGTGNMKLMINGALTLGTMDGANVEICQAVGEENMFLFGMRIEEVEALQASGAYSPWEYFRQDRDVAAVMKLLSGGIDGRDFRSILNSLTTGGSGGGDPYFVLADFPSYKEAQERVDRSYRDQALWNAMSVVNIAGAGVFSADRAVREYAENIWHIKPIV